MRQAFDVAYRYALTEKRGGAVPIIEHQSVADPVIEGSNTGIRRRQLQELFRAPGYNPLSASGMA